MTIEVVHIDECPNWAETAEDLRAVLSELGRADLAVVVRRVTTGNEALAAGFAGSPTILLDGDDPFPHGEPTGELACRVYLTEAGLRGRPSREQLRALMAERLAG
ncbi:alkylmercury lyase [Yonghaparkia sp. Soil809]|nr:alkylmercury lyase [Yonghaparkia sp. Root332]KRF33872.1 alkylmercury lyase [Yonghaparkia sp. Soil809]